MSLSGKNIIVGVTAGIAAYKTPDLVRRLREQNADVRVVMTQGATEFITPLTMQAVSGHAVCQYLLDDDAESGMGHIELAKWADDIIVAPATADFIAKMAHGVADDLLSTLILATEAAIHIAPAMNQQMWKHAAVKRNIAQLQQDGVAVIGPASGEQACGDIGVGRMSEVTEIVQALTDTKKSVVNTDIELILNQQHILITAGPTWEAIDPVRGLTNRSSGKMGYALAQAAVSMGAKVTVVSGPVCEPDIAGVDIVRVESALQMHDAVMSCIDTSAKNTPVTTFIGVAAVSDYRVDLISDQKIKKGADVLQLELIRNPDILADVAALDDAPFCVGFAAETESLTEYARSKLNHKKVDVVFANLIKKQDSVFGSEYNTITMITKDQDTEFPRMTKQELAIEMLTQVKALYRKKS